MRTLRLAVVGFGKLGRACIRAINEDEQSTLAGIVRQREHVEQGLSADLKQTSVVVEISALGRVDAALLCVPAEYTRGVAEDLLMQGIPIVECAKLHGKEFQEHKAELDKFATRHKVSAVVGAGCDPGALSVFRSLFAVLTPKGHTELSRRPGVSLHHTTLARAIPGVKEALSTELRTASGRRQHYVYIELTEGASLKEVETAIRSDPLYLEEETFVFKVDSVAALEQAGHGVVLERRGSSGPVEHQLFLLEGRYSEWCVAAQVMVAAARAVPIRRHGAYGPFDLPLGVLWGALRRQTEQEWI